MNSNFLDANAWMEEVAKMENAFGADIRDADAKVIGEYLTKQYGD